MPNIEIYGFSENWKGHTNETDWENAEALKRRIFELFEGRPFVRDMVVTIVDSDTTDAKNHSQPFLRLLSSNAREARRILQILDDKIPSIDVEYVKIERFIPKHVRQRK